MIDSSAHCDGRETMIVSARQTRNWKRDEFFLRAVRTVDFDIGDVFIVTILAAVDHAAPRVGRTDEMGGDLQDCSILRTGAFAIFVHC